MYNFDRTTIPAVVPVLEGVLLKPWFAETILNQGLALLRQERLKSFYCLRNAVGAIVDDALVSLQFESSRRLRQGFVIRNGYCSICRGGSDRDGCEHLAALALLSLITPEDGKKAMVLPLAFKGSDWEKIGLFLYDWLGGSSYTAKWGGSDEAVFWEIFSGHGSLRINIPELWARQASMLLPGESPQPQSKASKTFALLCKQLQMLVMTPGERALQEAGSSTIGWKRDTSCWIWLAGMLYCLHGNTLPEFRHIAGSFNFSLSLNPDDAQGGIHLVLPGAKAWNLVRQIDFGRGDAAILPGAGEFFRVGLNDKSELEIVPCVRLEDGRVLMQQELAKTRFPGGYYLPGEGFLAVKRVPGEGLFSKPQLQSTLPLLGFLHDEASRALPFTVPFEEIPAFLEANQGALNYPANRVAEEVLNTRIHSLPERLIIDGFEECDEWCYLSCQYGLGNTNISLGDILEARQKGLSCLPGRHWLQIENTPLTWLYDLAENRLTGDGSGRIRLRLQEMLALNAVIGEVEISQQEQQVRQRLKDLLDDGRWMDTAALGKIPDHLRDYQRNGLAWLMRLYSMGIGGLLADDMGLGKTHQALALIEAVRNTDGNNLCLVVCPASVVLNWADKIDRFYAGLDYGVYYGAQRDLDKAMDSGLILTTYGIVRQDAALLQELTFEVIILDEIQYLKNRTTATHRAVAALNGRVVMGLTGTPIENSLQDLYSLFDICLPGLLGSERRFNNLYVQPVVEEGSRQAKQMLSSLIRPFILRRNRQQVLTELPDIIEDNRICELSDDQVGLYRQVIDERKSVVQKLEDETGAIPYMNVLAMITRLKQICNHPSLVHGSLDIDTYASGKWDLFVELTQELLDAGMKFVVFSQYTAMLALIEQYFETMGIAFCSLKGDMGVKKRRAMIAEFNDNSKCRVFCASLLAGGVGIDLTSAQAVIHYDRWWNPAREEQATARVHRMGQKHVVQVFRLITRGTLEEKIHSLIGRKSELADTIIQEDEAGIIKQMDRRELAELLRLSP
jgi:superfamily II DNA or RNA helicase